MSGVTFPTTPQMGGTPYIDGDTPPQSPDRLNFSAPPPPVPEGTQAPAGTNNRGFTPDPASPNADMSALAGMMVATLSPGALLAAICVKDAAMQNEQNTTELLKRNDANVATMNKQADKIEEAAMQKMWLSIAGSVASAVGSIAGAATTFKVGASKGSFEAGKSAGDAVSSSGQSIGGILNAVGNYLDSKAQAENKRLDAQIEQNRTAMEALRNSMQAQRDLLNKSLDFMSSMQSNMNQTMSRILG